MQFVTKYEVASRGQWAVVAEIRLSNIEDSNVGFANAFGEKIVRGYEGRWHIGCDGRWERGFGGHSCEFCISSKGRKAIAACNVNAGDQRILYSKPINAAV